MLRILITAISCAVLLFWTSCNNSEADPRLQQLADSLQRKGDSLLIVEQQLLAREADLQQRELALDSTRARDSLAVATPTTNLNGLWDVSMNCTESTCTGFAVGDTKQETWEFSTEGSNLVVTAMTGKQVIRVYRGTVTGNKVELAAESPGEAPGSVIVTSVRLTINNDTKLEGVREIVRENACKVVYNVQMNKGS